MKSGSNLRFLAMLRRTLTIFITSSVALAQEPGTPELLSPKAGTHPPSTIFSWQPLTSATEYQIQVINSENTIVLNASVTARALGCEAPCTTGCWFTSPVVLSAGAKKWRVRARSANGTSAWSQYFSYSVLNPAAISPFAIEYSYSSDSFFDTFLTGSCPSLGYCGGQIEVSRPYSHFIEIDFRGQYTNLPNGDVENRFMSMSCSGEHKDFNQVTGMLRLKKCRLYGNVATQSGRKGSTIQDPYPRELIVGPFDDRSGNEDVASARFVSVSVQLK